MTDSASSLQVGTQGTHLPVVILAGDGRVLRWNPPLDQLFSKTISRSPQGMRWSEFWRDGEAASRAWRELQKHGWWAGRLRAAGLGGHAPGDLDVSLSLMTDNATGDGVLVVGCFCPSQSTSEAELDRDRLFNLSLDMLTVASFDGYFKQINPAWRRTLGWSDEELLSRPWLEFVHPEDRAQTIAASEQLRSGKPLMQFHNRYRCRDGGYRWLSWKAFPLEREDLIFAVARDITARVEAERTQREYRDFLQAVLDAIASLLVVVDCEERIVMVNEAWRRRVEWKRLGYENHGVGFHYARMCAAMGRDDGDDTQHVHEGLHAVLDGRCEQFIRERVCGDEAGSHWYEVRIHPLRFNGRPHAIIAHTDISDRKRAEEKTRRQQSELTQLYGLITAGEMLASVAHELNQPVGAIANFAQAAMDRHHAGKADAEGLCRALERIGEQADRAGQIVRGVYQLVRPRDAAWRDVDLNRVIHKVVRLLSGEFDTRGIDLRLRLESRPPTIEADDVQIEQVIMNLLNNSLRALSQKPAGQSRRMTITTRLVRHDVVVRVEDNGPGLSPDMCERVFDLLYTTATEQGLGLGLPICRKIVQRHGGRIKAEVLPEGGVAFQVTLPAAHRES